MVRVGIPRALLFYKYHSLWASFFKSLGLKPVFSPKTNKEVVRLGLKISSEEFCLPVKVFFGHVLWLADKVDQIFVPRMISLKRGTTTCPKLIALPDLLRYSPIELPPLLCPRISANLGGMKGAMYRMGLRFSRNPLKVWKAYRLGTSELNGKNGSFSNSVSGLRIGIVGHPYNLYDEYLTHSLLKELSKEHKLLLPEMRNGRDSRNRASHILYWIYERELYETFHSFLTQKVDGIINVVSFGCGPDSLVAELILRDCKIYRIPYLQLVIDEHTSRVALHTRVEAFTEMVKRRR